MNYELCIMNYTKDPEEETRDSFAEVSDIQKDARAVAGESLPKVVADFVVRIQMTEMQADVDIVSADEIVQPQNRELVQRRIMAVDVIQPLFGQFKLVLQPPGELTVIAGEAVGPMQIVIENLIDADDRFRVSNDLRRPCDIFIQPSFRESDAG